jgi:hypothetical protein
MPEWRILAGYNERGGCTTRENDISKIFIFSPVIHAILHNQYLTKRKEKPNATWQKIC